MHMPYQIAHPRWMVSRSSIFFAMICLVAFLAAYGGSANPTPGTTVQTPSATCNKSTGFTLYSAQGYDSDAAKAFQKQTGITTKLVDDSTGNLLAKIAAEGNNPQWDAAWFDGNGPWASSTQARALQRYLPKLASRPTASTRLALSSSSTGCSLPPVRR